MAVEAAQAGDADAVELVGPQPAPPHAAAAAPPITASPSAAPKKSSSKKSPPKKESSSKKSSSSKKTSTKEKASTLSTPEQGTKPSDETPARSKGKMVAGEASRSSAKGKTKKEGGPSGSGRNPPSPSGNADGQVVGARVPNSSNSDERVHGDDPPVDDGEAVQPHIPTGNSTTEDDLPPQAIANIARSISATVKRGGGRKSRKRGGATTGQRGGAGTSTRIRRQRVTASEERAWKAKKQSAKGFGKDPPLERRRPGIGDGPPGTTGAGSRSVSADLKAMAEGKEVKDGTDRQADAVAGEREDGENDEGEEARRKRKGKNKQSKNKGASASTQINSTTAKSIKRKSVNDEGPESSSKGKGKKAARVIKGKAKEVDELAAESTSNNPEGEGPSKSKGKSKRAVKDSEEDGSEGEGPESQSPQTVS